MAVITNENARQRLVRLVEQYQTDLLRLCYIQLHDTALAEDAGTRKPLSRPTAHSPPFAGTAAKRPG